ncbi:ATP-binding cassette domain-containing protein [Anaerococcus sp. AGMB00486]|uniref:ATP-binding cassette domain-containing protein n=1 Tax=Anaerococcus faecalis TaxID=2742993 RepID=A0ABX2NCC0_9FIRM|nr:ATP-binding cassette domain-containing protein [Anaerococcus faecalis]NVF12331.1 ATP-binding cassette domain-containing protein [Anaerococcus faecalis]
MLKLDIRKDFGNFKLDINFESEKGVLGILGASGSGKSLSLKAIAGIVKPDKGKIILNNRVLFDSDKKINIPTKDRKVAYLFQDYALFPNMTVYENIKCGFREKKENYQEIIYKKLDELHIYHIKDKIPDEISGGEKQRAALARILVNEPEILLLDEPYSAIDGYLKWSIELDIKNIIEEYKIPTLFVSHDRDEIYRMCDEIVIMDKGKSEDKKETKELFNNPKTMAAAELSGCKNFSKIKKSEKGIYAIDWDLDLSIEDVKNRDFIGIRAHNIKVSSEKSGENSFELELLKEIEQTFNMCLIIRKKSGKGILSAFLEKEDWKKLKNEKNLYFSIRKEDIMFLKEKNS